MNDTCNTKTVAKIVFKVMSAAEIARNSFVECKNPSLYDVDSVNSNAPAKTVTSSSGPLDTKLGVSCSSYNCTTCNSNMTDCPGHFGFIDLASPCFNSGFTKMIIKILQMICKNCSALLLTDAQLNKFRPLVNNFFRSANIYNSTTKLSQKRSLFEQILANCKKNHICFRCGAYNGAVKRSSGIRIIHDCYKLNKTTKKLQTASYNCFASLKKDLANAIKFNPDIKNFLPKQQQNLTPTTVLKLFQNIDMKQLPFFLMGNGDNRPEYLIYTKFPVPPACIRPTVVSTVYSAVKNPTSQKKDSVNVVSGGGTQEDDLTVKLQSILWANQSINDHCLNGSNPSLILEDAEYLQGYVSTFINGCNTTLPAHMLDSANMVGSKRGVVQRLKGKHGRFRGNLSGKRVDFSGRTVISPNPNLRINQVAVPIFVAKILTFPEKVNSTNIEKLKEYVRNGVDTYPGANYVVTNNFNEGERRIYLRFGNREHIARDLKNGDVVERHMLNDDIVLFNRQPSLHRISIMAHRAVVHYNKTLSFNECVCAPYNADFDGDEMNIHLVQTQEARAEAEILMGVCNNIQTPRNGEPLIALTQDFITGAYQISGKNTFLDEVLFWRLCSVLIGGANKQMRKVTPAIIKPVKLYTGKQLVTFIFNPYEGETKKININCKNKNCASSLTDFYNDDNDDFVVIKDSAHICGRLEKTMVGNGSKRGVFYHILEKLKNNRYAADVMWRFARVCPLFLIQNGFSIGIIDVMPSQILIDELDQLIHVHYKNCQEYIEKAQQNNLITTPGCSVEETLEAHILSELSTVRENAGKTCLNILRHTNNSPLTMALSGSKGSFINISQMIACVGQQAINGKRIPNGFENRSLPHFLWDEKTPSAKGFVRNSFYSGLTGSEFFFHTMAGREGLVDTAVKTAETGYMQRRLVKCLEDLCVQYDGTVRSSSNEIVQFVFGDDGMDPILFNGADNFVSNLESDNNNNNYGKYKIEEVFSGERYQILIEKLKNSNKKLNLFLAKTQYDRMMVEPGTAVGAIAAQSIGEPATQMTLKTFHFAGVATMNITLGVPRLKEIINAGVKLSTPIITAPLVFINKDDETEKISFARKIKAKIELTTLGEITELIEEIYTKEDNYLMLRFDWNRIKLLQLEISIYDIQSAILRTKKLKLNYSDIYIGSIKNESVSNSKVIYILPKNKTNMQQLKVMLDKVIIRGNSTITKAIISQDENTNLYNLLIEGDDMHSVMNTVGVDGRKTKSNNMHTVYKTLGIEAARQTIINEINYTMRNHGIGVDTRHVMLLADVMTYKGSVLGMTRYGLAKMKESTLMLASFEKTADHLFDAAYHGAVDNVAGVSESIILGKPMKLGTGCFKLLYDDGTDLNLTKKKTFLDGII